MTMTAKKREQVTVYHGTNVPASEEKQLIPDAFRFENYMVLKEFRGRHPAVMADRLRAARRWGPDGIDGSIGASTRRYCVAVFAGEQPAHPSFRFFSKAFRHAS